LPRSTDFKTAAVRGADGQREFRLEAGEHRVRFYLRETNALVESIRLVREGSLTATSATCSSSPFQDAGGGAAANGAFIVSGGSDRPATIEVPDGVRNRYQLDRNNYAEFCVTVEQGGRYRVAATVQAIDGNSNSFWVQVDENDPAVWHLPVAPAFMTRRVAASPLRLEAGEHRIRLYHRENTPIASVELQPVGR